MRSKHLSIFSLIFFLLIFAFACLTSLLKSVPLAGDFFFLFHPQNLLISEMLQKGALPLWNPYAHCGAPLLANLREGIFYPPLLLFRFFDPVLADQIFLLLHYFFAGLFGFCFATSQKLSRAASLLFSAAFAFNGFFFLHSAYYDQFAGMVWLPLVLLFLAGMTASNMIFAGIVFTFQFISGNPFFFYETVALAALLSVFTIFQGRKTWAAKAGVELKKGLLIFAVFLSVSAVQLFPFFESSKYSTRRIGLAFSDATVFSEPFSQVVKFILIPLWNWFNIEVKDDSTIVGFYVGIVLLLLSIAGLLMKADEVNPRKKIFWLFCFCASIFLSLGSNIPGYLWIWRIVPGLKYLRFPAQWLFLSCFFLILFAAYGLESIKNLLLKKILVAAVLIELFLFAAKNPFGVVKKDFFRFRDPEVLKIQAAPDVDRISHKKEGFGLGGYQLRDESDWLYAKKILLPNLSSPYHIPSASGYGITEPFWKAELFLSLSQSEKGAENWNAVAASPVEMVYLSESERNFRTKIHRECLPFAAVFASARFFDTDEALLRAVENGDFEKAVLIAGYPSSADSNRDSAIFRASYDRSENKIEVLPEEVKESSWLYLAESYYPGWKAFVDGNESKIWRANFAFSAIQLPLQTKSVIFVYCPMSFYLGAWLTTLSTLLLFAVCWRWLMRAASELL